MKISSRGILTWAIVMNFVCARLAKASEITQFVFRYYDASYSEITKTYEGERFDISADLLSIDLMYLHYVQRVIVYGSAIMNIYLISEHYDNAIDKSVGCNKSSSSRIEATFLCNSIARVLRVRGDFVLNKIRISGYNTFYEDYIGCYDIGGETFSVEGRHSLESCVNACKEMHAEFTAIRQEKRVECVCLNDIGNSYNVHLSSCSFACQPQQTCGGKSYFSVYSRDPFYTKDQALGTWKCYHDLSECPICATGRGGYTCNSFDCSQLNGNCGRLLCQNWFSSYSRSACHCMLGLRRLPRGDGNCSDVDECLFDVCQKNIATCANTDGSFRCICLTGYSSNADGTMCIDVDECENARVCERMFAVCANTEGGFTCFCLTGYKMNADNTMCIDYNECLDDTLCDKESTYCSNIPGSYECTCKNGFSVGLNRHKCEDVDECSEKFVDHCESIPCVNTAGSYFCQCPPGYELIYDFGVTSCRDIDECLHGFCLSGGALCINAEGSYKCLCTSGYVYSDDSNCTHMIIRTTKRASRTTSPKQNYEDDEEKDSMWMVSMLVLVVVAVAIALLNLIRTVFKVSSTTESKMASRRSMSPGNFEA